MSPLQGPVLVTGAGGFIGSWLTQALLARKLSVIAFLLPDDPATALADKNALSACQVVRGDLANPDDTDRALALNPRTVFHLGAQTLVGEAREHPWRTFESNVRGTYNLLESCRRTSSVERIVIASSDKAYGDAAALPYTEATPLLGSHTYHV